MIRHLESGNVRRHYGWMKALPQAVYVVARGGMKGGEVDYARMRAEVIEAERNIRLRWLCHDLKNQDFKNPIADELANAWPAFKRAFLPDPETVSDKERVAIQWQLGDVLREVRDFLHLSLSHAVGKYLGMHRGMRQGQKVAIT